MGADLILVVLERDREKGAPTAEEWAEAVKVARRSELVREDGDVMEEEDKEELIQELVSLQETPNNLLMCRYLSTWTTQDDKTTLYIAGDATWGDEPGPPYGLFSLLLANPDLLTAAGFRGPSA